MGSTEREALNKQYVRTVPSFEDALGISKGAETEQMVQCDRTPFKVQL